MKDLGNESSNSKTVIFLLTMGIILSIIYFFTFAWTIAVSLFSLSIYSLIQLNHLNNLGFCMGISNKIYCSNC